MKVRWNWGHSLIVFFTCYISFLIFTVFQSKQVNHTLVVEDYYAQDLAYQKKYDEIANRNLLEQDLSIQYTPINQSIELRFGDDQPKVRGTVAYYRPTDAEADRKASFAIQEHKPVVLPASELDAGKWVVQVRWTDADRTYYKEQSIFIPGP